MDFLFSTISILPKLPDFKPQNSVKDLLLGLNCGFYQSDIGTLQHTEFNESEGRIVRVRSKTKKHKNAPVVYYRLWPETLELVKKYRSSHQELLLLNEDGKPLWSEKVGKTKLDAIKSGSALETGLTLQGSCNQTSGISNRLQ